MEMERWRDRGEREERDQTADEVFFSFHGYQTRTSVAHIPLTRPAGFTSHPLLSHAC